MPIDFRNRVNKILNHAKREFGESITLYPKKGGSYALVGIFDNETELVDPDTEQVISSNNPMLGVNLFDLNFEVKSGDKVKVRNILYKIIDVRIDGQGGASLILHKCNYEEKVYKRKGARSS